MMIGRKILTLAAMAALSVSAILAQGTSAKPSSQQKMAEDPQTTSSQPSKKKAGKHGRHHKKHKKHASSTPTQDTTTKK